MLFHVCVKKLIKKARFCLFILRKQESDPFWLKLNQQIHPLLHQSMAVTLLASGNSYKVQTRKVLAFSVTITVGSRKVHDLTNLCFISGRMSKTIKMSADF